MFDGQVPLLLRLNTIIQLFHLQRLTNFSFNEALKIEISRVQVFHQLFENLERDVIDHDFSLVGFDKSDLVLQ